MQGPCAGGARRDSVIFAREQAAAGADSSRSRVRIHRGRPVPARPPRRARTEGMILCSSSRSSATSFHSRSVFGPFALTPERGRPAGPRVPESDQADRPDLQRSRHRRSSGDEKGWVFRAQDGEERVPRRSRRRCRRGSSASSAVGSGCWNTTPWSSAPAAAGSRSCTPTAPAASRAATRQRVEAVINKDLASAMLARDLHAEALRQMRRDIDGVSDWRDAPAGIHRAPHPCGSRRNRAAGRWGRKSAPLAPSSSGRGGLAVIGPWPPRGLLRGDAGTTVSAAELELAAPR